MNNFTVANENPPIPSETLFGGAIYMINGSGMYGDGHSLRARFINNLADSGSVIGLFDSSINIQGAYFINNGNQSIEDTSVFHVSEESSALDLNFSTIANNFSTSVFQVNNSGIVNLFGSIVYETFGNQILALADQKFDTFNFGCSIFHENKSIGGDVFGTTGSIVSQNPGFVSEETANYHLRYDSIAIDRCDDNGLGINLNKDSDLDIRGYDLPNINNGFQGDYDVGADEVIDLIFANGFEES